MNSRVYPPYKTKYRIANWASCDRALVGLGDVTLWVSPNAIATWAPAGVGARGGQRQYADVAIETALTLRFFHLPLRQPRHDRRLPCGERACPDRSGATGQNRDGISTEAAVELTDRTIRNRARRTVSGGRTSASLIRRTAEPDDAVFPLSTPCCF